MTATVRMTVLAGAVLGLVLVAGCGKPQATIRYELGGTDETVTYDVAVYQLARDEKIQYLFYRRTAAPIGYADPDFEYVFFELPDRSPYGWLKEDNVPAYRWVHHRGHDHLWQGTAGQVKQWSVDSREHMHLGFQATMEPVAGTEGGIYVLTGAVRCTEDIMMAQGLINRYDEWMRRLLGLKPPPAPATKSPTGSGPKSTRKKAPPAAAPAPAEPPG